MNVETFRVLIKITRGFDFFLKLGLKFYIYT
jgi:hypothetical protein